MTTGRETVAVRKFDSFLSRQQQMQQWTSRALNYLFSPPGTRVKSQYGQLFFLHFHRRRHRHRTVLAVSLNSEQQLKTRKISSWFKWNKIRWKLIRNNESSEQKREVSRSWLDRLPKRIQPYLRVMRLDKPVGFLLLYWPCTWGVAVASPPLSLGDFADFVHVVLSEPAAWSALAYHPVTSLLSSLTLFGLGAFFARSAGCIINDLWDRDIDARVERTKARPLASGTLSVRAALLQMCVLALGALSVLMHFNDLAIITALLITPVVILYPLVKRVSYWPQFVLGLAFNWGVLVAWANTHTLYSSLLTNGDLHLFMEDVFETFAPVFPLYLAGVAWTLVYDTIYAHQDRHDDALVGVKSTALRFGTRTRVYLALFGSLMLTGLLVTMVLHSRSTLLPCLTVHPIVSLLLVLPAALHLLWQIKTLKIDDPRDCARKFRSNNSLGALVFFTLLVHHCLSTGVSQF
jgi:4-hydroxybenzoate polyprenyl transferase